MSCVCFAEGTAQLTPTFGYDNQGVLQIWDNNDRTETLFYVWLSRHKGNYFSIYVIPETVTLRMNLTTSDLTGTSTLWCRIISQNNTVVFPVSGTGWQQVTNGAGSISSWAQAKKPGPGQHCWWCWRLYSFAFIYACRDQEFYIEVLQKSTAGMP